MGSSERPDGKKTYDFEAHHQRSVERPASEEGLCVGHRGRRRRRRRRSAYASAESTSRSWLLRIQRKAEKKKTCRERKRRHIHHGRTGVAETSGDCGVAPVCRSFVSCGFGRPAL